MGTEVSDHYQGDAGVEYAKARHSNVDSHGYDLNFQSFSPHLKPGDKVLDFGCGNGGMLRRLKDFGALPEGLEINPAAAAMAREQGFTVFASLDQIPADRRFDAVVSNHVLEHVRDPSTTLEQVRLRLRPGGKIILKLPIDDVRSRHQRGWSRQDVDHHLQTWTPRLLANTLFEAGYDVQRCDVLASAWDPRLFWTRKIGMEDLAFRVYARLRNRRQLVAVAINPAT